MIFGTPEHTTDEALRYIVDSLEAGIGLAITGEIPNRSPLRGQRRHYTYLPVYPSRLRVFLRPARHLSDGEQGKGSWAWSQPVDLYFCFGTSGKPFAKHCFAALPNARRIEGTHTTGC